MKKKLLSILKNKTSLFIENDTSLHGGLRNLENFMISNKLRYHTIFRAEKIPIETLKYIIAGKDVVIWETTYLSEISKQLSELVGDRRFSRQTLLELPLQHALCYHKPPNVNNPIYHLKCRSSNILKWNIKEIL